MTEYLAEWIDGRSTELYRGPSRAAAQRACAAALRYRDLRSAYAWTSTTETGDEAEFFARRRGLTEKSPVARIVALSRTETKEIRDLLYGVAR